MESSRREAKDWKRVQEISQWQSDRPLQAVFLGALDAMLVADDEGRYVDVNPAACELFGLPKSALLGRTFAEFTSADFDFAAAWQNFLQQAQMRGEVSVCRPDGSVRIAEFAATANILPGLHLSILRDVTERKRAEAEIHQLNQQLEERVRERTQALERTNAALRVNEQRYRAVIESQMELICRFLPDGTLTFVNEAYCRFFERSPDELIETNFLLLVPECDRPLVQAQLTELQALTPDAPEVVHVHQIVRGENPVGWQEWTNHGIFDKQGRLIEIQAIGRDITQQLELEIELRANQAKLNSILGSVQGVIWSMSADHSQTLYLSPLAEQIYGRPVADFLADSTLWFECIHPDDQSLVETASQEFYTLGHYTFEYRIVRPDGQIRWLYDQANLIRDAQGVVQRVDGLAIDITERKQMEAQLRLQSAALEACADGIVITDRQGTIEWMNPAFAELTGYTVEEAIGKNPRDLVNSGVQDRAFFRELWHRILSKRVWRGELVNRRKDGSRYAEKMTITPVLDEWGEISHFIAIKQDISDRKQMEDALRQSELFFRTVFENAEVGIAICAAPDYTICRSNPYFQELLGYTAEELTSLNVTGITYPDDLPLEQTFIQECFAGERDNYQLEKRYICKDGSIRWVSLTASIVRDETGQISFGFAIAKNITARKQAEAALAESERRFRAVFNQTFQLSSLLTPEGVILEDNETALAFCRLNREEIIGRNFWDLHCWQISPEVRGQLQWAIAAAANGATLHYEVDIWAPDCSVVTVDFSLKPLRNEAGNVELLIAEGRDISDRKRIELALRESEERYRLALEAAQMGTWDWNLRTNQVIWSDQMHRLMGMAQGSFNGNFEQVAEMIHPEDRDRVFAAIQRSIHQGEPYRIEFRFTRPDGSVRWATGRGEVFRDASGIPMRMTGVDLDITDRKLAEIKLHESRQRYHDLIQSIDGIVWEFDWQTNLFSFVSQQAVEVLGYPLERWLTEPGFWDNHIYPSDRDWAVEFCQQSAEVGQNHEFDYRMIAADGRVVWLRDIVAVVPQADGSRKLRGVMFNISDRKAAEQALHRYERIVSATPDAVALIDQDYCYQVVNQTYLDWNGKAREAVIGRSVPDLLGEELFFSIIKLYLDRALAGEPVYYQNWFNYPVLGSQFIGVTYSPYCETNGNISGVVVISRNLTALKLSEIAIQQQAEREKLLSTITNHIRQSLELDQILSATVNDVRQTLNADRVLIFKFDPTDIGNVIAEAIAPHSLVERLQIEPEEACVLPDVMCDAPIVHHLEDGTTRVWGLLIVHAYSQECPWVPEEVDFLQRIADQLAIAIQQSELYKQVRELNSTLDRKVRKRTAQLRQAYEFEALLNRITERLRDSLDEQRILDAAIQELAEKLGIQFGNIILYDISVSPELEPDRCSIVSEYSEMSPELTGLVLSAVEFPEIQRQLFANIQFQFCVQLLAQRNRWITALMCPFVSETGALLGDILLLRSQEMYFDEAETKLVQQVANQCAIALRQSRLYQAAQAQVLELERLNHLKDDFLSTVSHELRTPMANIKMATQMVELQLIQSGILAEDSDEPINRYFQILKDEGQREIQLINDLLDLARLDAQVEPLMLTEIQLHLWIYHITEAFVERTSKQGQRLIIQIPDALSIRTDLSYLERILLELLNNACKYSPLGSEIRVIAELPQTTAPILRLTIGNSGIELPAQECDRIFEKFYRIPNNDPWKHGGTGLGLALVKKLVEQLRGKIWAESSNGETRFIIEFPL